MAASQMFFSPGAHDTAINHLADHILLGLFQDLQAEHATIYQQHVVHTDIVNEAVVIDRDAAILAIGTLLDCEGILGT